MGGIGSGRDWVYGARNTTDDYRPIDIRIFVTFDEMSKIAPEPSIVSRFLVADHVGNTM